MDRARQSGRGFAHVGESSRHKGIVDLSTALFLSASHRRRQRRGSSARDSSYVPFRRGVTICP
jgi:hypothetical protein